MNIEKTLRPDHAVLRLRGDFDMIYGPDFSREIDLLLEQGISHVVVNLRLTRFIGSTAMGAISSARKRLVEAGGDLVVSRPSSFCRDVMGKVGLDKVIRIFDDDGDAIAAITGSEPIDPGDDAGVLFTFEEESRRDLYGRKVGVGRLRAIDDKGIDFVVGGGDSRLDLEKAAAALAAGTKLRVKIRLGLYQRRKYFQIPSAVTSSERSDDGTLRVRARFGDIAEEDLSAIRQFVKDMITLRAGLKTLPGSGWLRRHRASSGRLRRILAQIRLVGLPCPTVPRSASGRRPGFETGSKERGPRRDGPHVEPVPARAMLGTHPPEDPGREP